MSPKEIILAHQYLYYVKSNPIWTDFEYDRYCDVHGIPGNGGSDLGSDYSSDIIALALRMERNPKEFFKLIQNE